MERAERLAGEGRAPRRGLRAGLLEFGRMARVALFG